MIRLISVSKTVTSGAEKLTILHKVDLSVARGQFVAVVGPSGSGKSTLLSLIAGLDGPTTGYIALDGEYLTQMSEDELARLRGAKVGFIFQSFHLVPSLTAYENILVPMEVAGLPGSRARAQALLDEVGLHDRGHHYPSQLSGGEQQRVAIARAFSNDPPILLADEPTGNLDSGNGAHIFELLARLNRTRGTTLLFVTHDHALADRADRVISLSEGRIVEDRERENGGGEERGKEGWGEWEGGRGALGFILSMAWREMRASWYRLLLFFLSIAIGVGSIVSLRSLIQNIRAGLAREVHAMYGADVRVGINQPWKPETRAVLERYSASPMVTAHTEMLETQTMVRAADDPNGRPFMVQLRAVREQFPLYGEIRLVGGGHYTPALVKDRGVLVQPGLLANLNLKVGDAVKIGQLTFTIRGVMEFMPGSAMQFGPVQLVAMDYADAVAAGLTAFGSRVNYGWLFKTHEGQDEALLKNLADEFRTTRLNWLGSFRFQQDWMTQSLENIERFLALVGLAILVLGGIGISSVTRVFVQQKFKTIAILKCLGGENRQVLGAYLVQVIALSLVGSLLGLLLAWAVTHLASGYAAGRLPVEVVPGLTWASAVHGVGVGVLITLLFSLPPLLEIRKVKPILVLRQDAAARRRFDWLRLGSGLILVLGLFTMAFWISGSLRKTGMFMGEVVGAALVLNLAGAALIYLLRRVRHLPSFALRQGVGSLYRPGNQTKVILSAVGLGALFIIAVRLQQVNVLSNFDLELDGSSADMFLMDVQKEQRAQAEETLTRLAGTAPKLVPIVQARIVGLERDRNNPSRLPAEEVGRRLRWEQRFSYRPSLEPNEKIVAGKFWEPTPGAEPEISVEEEYARDLALGLGDKLIFDILGQRITARVTSIRRLERRRTPVSFITRFNVLFRPGALESAPQTYIGAVKGPPPGARRSQMQREFVEQFPNVTLVDAFDTIAEIRKRTGEFSFAVSFVGGFVFLCGVLILAGSVAMTKYQRLYEAAILKTLGAQKKLIVYITLIEYGVLGLLAGLIGSSAAMGLTWAFCKYEMRIPWQFAPGVNLTGVAVTLLLVAAVGVVSSWDVMMKKPLGILRAE